MNSGRMTSRQKEILELLSGDAWYFEIGTQPYSSADITYLINMGDAKANPNAVRATLKLLAKKGLVSIDRKKASVFTGLGEIQRELDHYWNVSTKEGDEKTAKEWKDGADKRSADAFERMFGSHSAQDSKLIDVN